MNKIRHLLSLCCLLLACITAMAQNRTVTGRIASAKDNSPISGATVSVKGTNRSVAASADGSFSISVPEGPATLVVSSIAFTSQEIEVAAGQSNISVALADNNNPAG